MRIRDKYSPPIKFICKIIIVGANMNYIEQLDFIFSINEDVCGGFSSAAAQAQWNVLIDMGFRQDTKTSAQGSLCALLPPTKNRLDQLTADGWPPITWQVEEMGRKIGDIASTGNDILNTTHGSKDASVGGMSGAMKSRFGIVLKSNESTTFAQWLADLDKELDGKEYIYNYVKEKYPTEYKKGREDAIKQLWRDSLSRPKAAADKIRQSLNPSGTNADQARPKRNIHRYVSRKIIDMAQRQEKSLGPASSWVKTLEEISNLTKQAVSLTQSNDEAGAFAIADMFDELYDKAAQLSTGRDEELEKVKNKYLRELKKASTVALSPSV